MVVRIFLYFQLICYSNHLQNKRFSKNIPNLNSFVGNSKLYIAWLLLYIAWLLLILLLADFWLLSNQNYKTFLLFGIGTKA